MMRLPVLTALFLALAPCAIAQTDDDIEALNQRVVSLYQEGRYEDSITVALELRETLERVFGPDHPNTLASVSNLALLYSATGRYAEAEPLYLQALEARERTLGPDHPDTLNSLNNLAELYRRTGRYAEAEPLYVRALEASERVLDPDHPNTLALVNNLAALKSDTGRYAEAEPLYMRALEARERTLGPDHPNTLASVSNLATLYSATGRYAEAEPLYLQALEAHERTLGPDHPDTLTAVNNLAHLYSATGRYAEAEPLYERALEALERVFGPDHPNTLSSVSNLAELYRVEGRYAEAEPLYLRALEARERTLGPDHPDTLASVSNLAFFRSDAASALGTELPALTLPAFSAQLSRFANRFALEEPDMATLSNPTSQPFLARRVSAAYRNFMIAGDIAGDDPEFLAPGFTLSQAFVFSSAGDALRASTAALTVDDPALRTLVDQHNAASADLEAAEAALAIILAQPVEEQNPAATEYARVRVDRALEALRQANDALFAVDVDLAELAVARTSSVDEVQSVLAPDEALVFYSQAAEGDRLTAFIVTPDAATARPLEHSPEDLAAQVETLRSGLALDAGEDYRLNTADLRAQAFDMETAKALHDAILAPLREYLGSARRIMVVADGPLQTLPLHVLVSELPGDEVEGFARYREANWLSEEFAFARLPAVSSLVALRRDATPPPSGERQLIGFGDPVLAGYDDAPVQTSSASEVLLQFANASGATQINDLPALRQTGVLLREVQTTLDLPDEDIYLGSQAVEAALERLNTGGRLQSYRSLAFATHALINDEIEGLDEPAIVLTPTDDSDGLLRASEVVQLDLDAGLVILAACNTAAADGSPGAEALSGLAKAFYYAGARALLVSNWPAEAGATAELVPDLVEGIEDEGLPRSVALQRAMNTLRDDHRFDFYAHPALWAPFMVAADG